MPLCAHEQSPSFLLTALISPVGRLPRVQRPPLTPSSLQSEWGNSVSSMPEQTDLIAVEQTNAFLDWSAYALSNLMSAAFRLWDLRKVGSCESLCGRLCGNMCCSAHLGKCWRCTQTLGCLSDSSQTGGLALGSASSWTKKEKTNEIKWLCIHWIKTRDVRPIYEIASLLSQSRESISCYFLLEYIPWDHGFRFLCTV